MKALIVAAGTKYLAMSIVREGAPILSGCRVTEILRLMIPSRHKSAASNSPDPEFPVESTSAIAVPNPPRRSAGIARRGRILEVLFLTGTATTDSSTLALRHRALVTHRQM